jgi:hypothetical protein
MSLVKAKLKKRTRCTNVVQHCDPSATVDAITLLSLTVANLW